jgi:thymidine phosphorylase
VAKAWKQIIAAKRDGGTLSQEDIEQFIAGTVSGDAPDYVASALLMSIYFKGMTTEETTHLLKAMIQSGQTLDWSADSDKPIADKHSTGGVGDKTSFLVLPLLIASGCIDPMVAGRGLGHTGGTLDKFESLPGLTTDLSTSQMHSMVRSCGGFLAGQTRDLVPADGKLYALRDVTATIESIPLIVSSILSKKIASGTHSLVMDVKFGIGAFMQERSQARALAKALVATGQSFGVNVIAALSSMDEPLGEAAGNSVEMAECLDILEGKKSNDVLALSLELCAGLMQSLNPSLSAEEHGQHLLGHITSGRAREILARIAIAQGAQPADFDRRHTDWLLKGMQDTAVLSSEAGYLTQISARNIGNYLLAIGAGRRTVGAAINHRVGVLELRKTGEWINRGEPLCILRHPHGNQGDLSELRRSFILSSERPPEQANAPEVQPIIGTQLSNQRCVAEWVLSGN